MVPPGRPRHPCQRLLVRRKQAPVLFANVLGPWGKDIAQFMPSEAGGSFIRSIREPHTLPAWEGLGVLSLWAALGIVTAATSLRRRDVPPNSPSAIASAIFGWAARRACRGAARPLPQTMGL